MTAKSNMGNNVIQAQKKCYDVLNFIKKNVTSEKFQES